MNICMICPELGGSAGNAFIGGHANTVVQLTQALSNKGHEITIITTPHRYPGKRPEKDILKKCADVHMLSISGSYSSIRYGFEFAYKAIKKIKELHPYKKFDIIHGHSGYTMPAMITGISGKFINVPSVQTIYCPIKPLKDNYNFCRIFSNSFLSALYLSSINKIIASTINIKKSLISAGVSEDKTIMIPPGLDMQFYNPNVSGAGVRKEHKITHDQPTLVYVGNLTAIKGIHVLIDALSIVAKTVPDIKLLMVLNMPINTYKNPGDLDIDMGMIFEIKENIQNYGLDSNIIPLGLLDNMPQVIAAGDVFVTPFLNTVGVVDYPISMVEAMALGKPIVATKVGGIPEIIEHQKSGLLVNPNEKYELSNAILYLIENKNEAKKMGFEGLKTSEMFNREEVVKKLESAYEEILRNNGGIN